MEARRQARLTEAIRLRQTGEGEAARQILLGLAAEAPDDPVVAYQCAWAHDALGLEAGAVPFYERAIAGGLSGEDLAGAYLGLGSTYRCLGRYADAVAILRRACGQFPARREFPTFLAMALYNAGEHREAIGLLLHQVAETSSDAGIQGYRRAILHYADRLDEVWPADPPADG